MLLSGMGRWTAAESKVNESGAVVKSVAGIADSESLPIVAKDASGDAAMGRRIEETLTVGMLGKTATARRGELRGKEDPRARP